MATRECTRRLFFAHRYTVLTYDRRGNSRSRFTDPDAAIDVAAQAGDAVAVLDHYGVQRAYVFGGSGGAIIALEVLAHHADRLLGLVAHEPPLVSLLPNDSPERRALTEIARLAQQKSPLRAYAAFGAMVMDDPPWLFRSAMGRALVAGATRIALPVGAAVRRITGGAPSSMTRQLGNADLLLRRELPAHRPGLSTRCARAARGRRPLVLGHRPRQRRQAVPPPADIRSRRAARPAVRGVPRRTHCLHRTAATVHRNP